MRGAARENGIPESSLRGHILGTTLKRKRGKMGVLTNEEEVEFVQYLLKMENVGFPLTIGQLREKVGILTQSRDTPFKDGVPDPGWIKYFRGKHPKLAIRKAQALEQKRARNLCPKIVSTFYCNLQRPHDTNHYLPHQIWNCDEIGTQAGKDGGGYVIAKKDPKACKE